MSAKQSLPPDEAHVAHLFEWQAALASETVDRLSLNEPSSGLISISMSALYQAATCHRSCSGGPHILEALAGRAYNLAASSLALTRVGQYDEALHLIRGLGEIQNLLLLFLILPDELAAWLNASKAERLRDFGPAAVRRKLEGHVPAAAIGQDWYAELCEKYVHVQPHTRPNMHSPDITGFAGGMYQQAGEQRVVEYLANVIVPVALAVSKYLRFNDIHERLGAIIHSWGKST